MLNSKCQIRIFEEHWVSEGKEKRVEQYYTNGSEQTSRNRDLQSYDTITNVAAFLGISIFLLL